MSAPSDPLTGIVLAGGQSRRMGRDKAVLPLGGNTLLSRVLGRLSPLCGAVLVVARETGDYADCGAAVIADRWPNRGPLAGLHAGLGATKTSYALVVACDLPFIEPVLLAGLAARADGWDVVVPRVSGRLEALCAVYRTTVAPVAEDLLRRGRGSLRDLLESGGLRVQPVPESELRRWDPALRSFQNVNTRADYDEALRLADTEVLARSASVDGGGGWVGI